MRDLSTILEQLPPERQARTERAIAILRDAKENGARDEVFQAVIDLAFDTQFGALVSLGRRWKQKD